LYVGGPCLASGYFGRPEATAARFVTDPFDANGDRLFRTGDRVRQREDGALELLGRLDAQLKVRGHRVEPEEVERALRRHPSISGAAVGSSGGQLVACLVPEHPGQSLDPAELRTELRRTLPEYMIPSSYSVAARLPLMPNGKVDRSGVASQAAVSIEGGQVAPRTDAEKLLASVWKDVLGLEQVGIDDDFFTYGGDSLQVMRAVARVRALGLAVDPAHFFRQRTVRGIARISGGRAVSSAAGHPDDV
jgi:aryl carrier-like protein